jgi:hypothetical protein
MNIYLSVYLCICFCLHVCRPSLKDYLVEMYPNDESLYMCEYESDSSVARDKLKMEWSSADTWENRIDGAIVAGVSCSTYILQSIRHASAEIAPVYIGHTADGVAAELKVTVVIKRENRRKFNSHEWFLSAFCRQYQPKYCFMGDTGSQLSHRSLATMLTYMDNNLQCTAVCCRMRVTPMTHQQYKNASFRVSTRRKQPAINNQHTVIYTFISTETLNHANIYSALLYSTILYSTLLYCTVYTLAAVN